jgi:hypothetical protein
LQRESALKKLTGHPLFSIPGFTGCSPLRIKPTSNRFLYLLLSSQIRSS